PGPWRGGPAVATPTAARPPPPPGGPARGHAAAPHPRVQAGEIAGGEPGRRSLRLAAQEQQHRVVAGEVSGGEVGIKTAVLDGISGVVPGAGGTLGQGGIGEHEVQYQRAPRLRLARADEERGGGEEPAAQGAYCANGWSASRSSAAVCHRSAAALASARTMIAASGLGTSRRRARRSGGPGAAACPGPRRRWGTRTAAARRGS